VVIAAYGAMAIWWREPVLVLVALMADGVLDVGKAVPARVRRAACTLRSSTSGHAQSDQAMRRRTGR
jgi:hypothetical protein